MTENADPLVPENKDKSSGGKNPSSRNVRDRRIKSDRRETVVDRRSGLDRRDFPSELKLPDMETRRGAGIRRPEDRRSAEEGELTTEQFEFVMAIEEYKRANHKTFPTWTEVLGVIKLLGYRKENTGEEFSANSENSTLED